MSIRKEVKTEKEKLKNMPWKDKLWYIWEYYKFHMLALILAAGVVWTIGNMIYRQSFTTRLSLAIINDRNGAASSTDGMVADLRKVLNCGKKDLIEVNDGLSVSFDDTSQMGYAALVKISALVASKSLDVVIGDKAVIDHYGSADAFLNLEEYLPPALYQKIKDQIYSAGNGQGTPLPVAVSLKNTALAGKTGILMNPPYLAVMSNAPHKEAVLSLIEYLFP